MKKTLCTILALTAIGLTLVSCNNKKPEEGKITVEDKSCKFTFQCPESWEITETKGMLAVRNPEDANISKANVQAISFYHGEDSDISSKDYFEKYYKPQYEETLKKMENLVLETENVTLSTLPAVHASYTTTFGDETFYCETVLCSYAGYAYVITLTQGAQTESNKEHYNHHGDEFEEIYKSFEITG